MRWLGDFEVADMIADMAADGTIRLECLDIPSSQRKLESIVLF
jgi:hypothetical protein